MLTPKRLALIGCGLSCMVQPASAEDTDATLTFAARPQVIESGHSTTLSGHTFIIIGLKTSHDIKEEVFGFYPVKDSLKGIVKGRPPLECSKPKSAAVPMMNVGLSTKVNF
jgi:hypothetical protein